MSAAIWYSLPAIAAVSIKLLIVGAWINDKNKHRVNIILVFLLVALTAINVSELAFFASRAKQLNEPIFGQLYFIASAWALLFLVHFCVREFHRKHEKLCILFYLTAILVTVLILSGDIISGFREWKYAYTKIPADGYWIFEIYSLFMFGLAAILLIANSIFGIDGRTRLKARWMLIGFTATFVAVPLIIILQKMGINWINTLITLPITLTILSITLTILSITLTILLVTLIYASVAHSLIVIPLPFSKDNKEQKRLELMAKLISTTVDISDNVNLPLMIMRQNHVPIEYFARKSSFQITEDARQSFYSKQSYSALEKLSNKINDKFQAEYICLGYDQNSYKKYFILR